MIRYKYITEIPKHVDAIIAVLSTLGDPERGTSIIHGLVTTCPDPFIEFSYVCREEGSDLDADLADCDYEWNYDEECGDFEDDNRIEEDRYWTASDEPEYTKGYEKLTFRELLQRYNQEALENYFPIKFGELYE